MKTPINQVTSTIIAPKTSSAQPSQVSKSRPHIIEPLASTDAPQRVRISDIKGHLVQGGLFCVRTVVSCKAGLGPEL